MLAARGIRKAKAQLLLGVLVNKSVYLNLDVQIPVSPAFNQGGTGGAAIAPIQRFTLVLAKDKRYLYAHLR